MRNQALTRLSEGMPVLFDDFFKPWNEMFENSGYWGRTLNMPAVNIIEHKDEYLVSLAAPGMKKGDFKDEKIIGINEGRISILNRKKLQDIQN